MSPIVCVPARSGSLAGRLDAAREATAVVGASLGVLSRGELEIAHSGLADAEHNLHVGDHTRFQIASLTKPMVATVIAKLASERKLGLDDALTAHIPELAGSRWGEQVTILDLLANRGGVPMTSAVEFEFADEGDACLAELAVAVAGQEPSFEPRTAWSYNNTGWCLLGRAIEVVCGEAWETAMLHQLLEPLEMDETVFSVEAVEEATACYEQRADETTFVEPWRHRALGPAGGTMWSTVRDLLRFADVHLEDGRLPDGSGYAAPGVLAALRTVEERRSLPDFMDAWGRGWAQFDWSGGPVWGWCGIAAGQRAILQLVPDARGALVLTSNSSRGRDLYRALFPAELERFGVTMPSVARSRAAANPGDLASYEGTFGWPDYELLVSSRDDRLTLSSPELSGDAFPIDERVFALESDDPDLLVIVFDDFDVQGRPQALFEIVWRHPRLRG
ncbi:MAG TPA: serine hydrolase domain-containing protein [Gaiellaceae bacterium]|jgi:CubicO group peptidase (beta-lactamase class C family)